MFRQATATTSAETCVEFNEKRTAVTIRNLSAQQVFISEDPTGVTARGFFLNQYDSIGLLNALGDDARNKIYCQTAAATADLRIEESFGDDKFNIPIGQS